MRRRDFGKLVGMTAWGVGAGGTANAAARTWRTTGTAYAALKSFDDTLKTFMQARNISNGQVAVTTQGRLVLARGYTWAEPTKVTAQPTSLFRIASISKPVTAAAIMRLVQEGKLSLTAPVTSILPLKPPPGQTVDSRLPQVTVKRLLQHLGGWNRDVAGDPMFADRTIASALGATLPVNQGHIMSYVTGKPLNANPGSAYAYSNYGYLLLGRIIRQVSGLSYAAYVQQKILSPVGIKRMRQGRTSPLLRASTEVPYFSQYKGKTVLDPSGTVVPNPDGAFNLENMEAHGGWLASAVDLVRFARIFDTPVRTPVLTASSIASAWAVPETGIQDGAYYGLGWSVRPSNGSRNTWHTGGLDGTSTILVRTYNDWSWAAVFNQRDDPSGQNYDAIDGLLWDAARAVTNWPTHDLFPKYF